MLVRALIKEIQYEGTVLIGVRSKVLHVKRHNIAEIC